VNDVEKRLQPWMRGPYELIRHANGHLIDGGDTDRRLALIGFDNAIEVSIDAFIRLHPKLRNGLTLSKEEVDRALKNYHSKIEFLDGYLAADTSKINIPIDSVVWYHQLRNELYHTGNGMVPENHVLKGSRAAAIQVFNALFKVDITEMLEGLRSTDAYARVKPYAKTDNDQMEFLRVFIAFEESLRNFLEVHFQDQISSLRSMHNMWQFYLNNLEVEKELDRLVTRSIEIRNSIAHGQKLDISEDSLITIVIELMDLISNLEDRT
jgi:hypothetical protein